MDLPVEQPVLVYDRIEKNHRQTRITLLIFGALLLPALLYVSMYLAVFVFFYSPGLFDLLRDDAVWGPAVCLFIMIMVILATVALTLYFHYRLATALALRIARAVPYVERGKDALRRSVENLCLASGLPQPGLYLIESSTPNAFTVGLGPECASLVVTRGLLELLDRRELEGVVAHELSHIGNHDIRLSTIVAAFAALLQIPIGICRFLYRVAGNLGLLVAGGAALFILGLARVLLEALRGITDPRAMLCCLFCLFMTLYIPFLAPFIGMLIPRIVSRKRELLADADAVLLTRNPQALALALVKISSADQTSMKVNSAMAHLYIVDPQVVKTPSIENALGPEVVERIGVLAGMAQGIPQHMLDEAQRAGEEFGKLVGEASSDLAQKLSDQSEREMNSASIVSEFHATTTVETKGNPGANNEDCISAAGEIIEKSRICKVDEKRVGEIVKCQFCGKEQPLAPNFKCIDCSASTSYVILLPSDGTN